MRVEHIITRIEQQSSLRDLILGEYDNLIRPGTDRITSQRINARLTLLLDTWDKFSTIHDAINLSISKLQPDEQTLLQGHHYFTDAIFASTRESYVDTVEKMNILLDSRPSVPETSNTQSNTTSGSIPAYFHHAKIPRIQIPKFNGSPSDWLSFKDLFNSIIISNPALTAVEKLQYLKTSITGSASLLLKNTALTSDNFQKAWDAMVEFYENKRLLVNSALHSLLSLKRINKESASELEQLYTNVTQLYRTLETLQRPVNTWDDFLVFVTVRSLDSESVKWWEQKLGGSRDPPTWKQLCDFLVTRLLSLQAFERSCKVRNPSQARNIPVKVHHQGKVDNLSVHKFCPLCSENHHPSRCSKYDSQSVPQRLALIAKHKMCYNCLGPHRSSVCRVAKRCQKCGYKHHTTIHRGEKQEENKKPSKSKSAPVKPVNTKVTSEKNEASVLHTSCFHTTAEDCVLLATASVNLITGNGDVMRVRILIDQGSEISLIKEKLVQLLRLPRTQSSIAITGVGEGKANRTRGVTSFFIAKSI